jgi:hypothetical protein
MVKNNRRQNIWEREDIALAILGKFGESGLMIWKIGSGYEERSVCRDTQIGSAKTKHLI